MTLPKFCCRRNPSQSIDPGTPGETPGGQTRLPPGSLRRIRSDNAIGLPPAADVPRDVPGQRAGSKSHAPGPVPLGPDASAIRPSTPDARTAAAAGARVGHRPLSRAAPGPAAAAPPAAVAPLLAAPGGVTPHRPKPAPVGHAHPATGRHDKIRRSTRTARAAWGLENDD
jgi:hypothetical protein